MDEFQRIELFARGDARDAEHAFIELASRIRRFLGKYLVSSLPREQDREDVCSIVLERLWTHRMEFELTSVGGFWAYTATIARRCALDHLGKQRPTASLDEVPEADFATIGVIADNSELCSKLYGLADEVWLGIPQALSDGERNRRVLAAQLHYLNSAPWNEVSEIVGFRQAVSREELDAWLADESVVMEMCFRELYFDNDALVAHLIGLAPALTSTSIDELAHAAKDDSGPAPAGWTWAEVRIALWRYRNGLTPEKIQQMAPSLKQNQIESTIDRCESKLPFKAAAQRLKQSLANGHGPRDILTAPGLWKRLVFQYHASGDLPQRHILERTKPAAEVLGYKITSGMLNVWLSNGRLFTQLAEFADRTAQ